VTPPIAKAVIPAGGLGTRMLPATLAVPKEMLPVAGVPMIHYAVSEAFGAGIRRICIVTAPGKRAIAEYFLHRPVEETGVPGGRPAEILAELALMREEARFVFIEQTIPRGLGDAVWQTRDFVDGAPFALLLPDNVFTDRTPVISRLIEAWSTEGLDSIALGRVTAEQALRIGNCGGVRCRPLDPGGEDRPGRCYRIEALQDKGQGCYPLETAHWPYRTAPRHVLGEHFFYYLARQRRDQNGGELDDVPVLQEIIRRQGLVGVLFDGEVHDTGTPAGYDHANRSLGR